MNYRSTVPAITSLVVAALISSPAARAAAPSAQGGAQVGQWKTWVLASGSEIPVPAPPADNSDQTKKELDELRQLQTQRTEISDTAIQYYFAVPATQRWNDLAFSLAQQAKFNNNRQLRLAAILQTALYDAVVASWAAKYTYNRKPPSQLAPDLTVVQTAGGPPASTEPSYPSEHAAIAATAAGILSSFFPNSAADLKAMAAEVDQARLQMGANYRSDLEAGSALGQVVAQKALARAATDGSDAVWTGTVPVGPGLWVGMNPVEPLEGSWKPWLMTSGSQFRPGPPPAFGSPAFQADLATVKQYSSNATPSQRALAVTHATNTANANYWAPAFAVVQRDRLTIPQEARLLALVGAVEQDAAIASHDAKYTYWRLRPNMADPTIMPYIPQPNHPSYVSNAAIISSALSEIMAYLSPQDAPQFRAAAEESGWGRIFGGIHYPVDEQTGAAMGKSLAALAIQHDQLSGP